MDTPHPIVSALAAACACAALAGAEPRCEEPSGVAPSADGSALLVVDDETRGHLFLVGLDGARSARPIPLRDAATGDAIDANDLEAITAADDHHVAITSFRDPSSAASCRLLRIRIVDGVATATPDAGFTAAALGAAVGVAVPWERGAVDIEGMAFDRRTGALLVGLRRPIRDGAATIVEYDPAAGAFGRSHAIATGSWGISDLHLDPATGELLIAANPVGKEEGDYGRSVIHTCRRADAGWTIVSTIAKPLPGAKLEGLCALADGGLALVYDPATRGAIPFAQLIAIHRGADR